MTATSELAAALTSSSRQPVPALRIAILIPCFNEEVAIPKVVREFRESLPTAEIYVYDNSSTDRTVQVARDAGAVVRTEPLQGKGNVVRRMFADIEADVYVLVDGDDTYDPLAAPMLVQRLLDERLDMVNGARTSDIKESYRPGHRLGNKLLTGLVSSIFGRRFRDMLSGYRAFSRRFVKSFPALAAGFEIETELTIHALELKLPVSEITTRYKERPEGSASKLRTFRDGFRILSTIVKLLKSERPFGFFGSIAAVFFAIGILLSVPLIITFFETGLVPRLPTAVLVVGLMVLSSLSFACGLILDTVTQGRRELRRLAYLRLKTF